MGLACILVGVVLLAHPPARYAVTPEAASSDKKMVGLRALGTMAIYVIIVGVGAFLEKPALKGLDATQLNGLMAIAMTAVAGVALAVRGPRLPMTKRTLGGFGVGSMIGIVSVFYFLGLAGLPASVRGGALERLHHRHCGALNHLPTTAVDQRSRRSHRPDIARSH